MLITIRYVPASPRLSTAATSASAALAKYQTNWFFTTNMNLRCLVGLHRWQGCKCERCGETRDEGHDWSGCKCLNCGKTRDQSHNWPEDREGQCSACGIRRDQSDDWVKNFEKSADPVTWNLWLLQHRPNSRLDAARELISLKDKGLHTHDISIRSDTYQDRSRCGACETNATCPESSDMAHT
jgi:hypothetical protein